MDLGWSILPHPLYSPDLAPSDFRLFTPQQNDLIDKTILKKIMLKHFRKITSATNQLNFTCEESTI